MLFLVGVRQLEMTGLPGTGEVPLSMFDSK